MIKLENVSKYYYLGQEKITALDGISLCVNDGEFVSVVGPSGSGKSTLMHIIGALDKASDGNCFINFQNTSNLNETKLSEIRKNNIGFIFQGFNLVPSLSAFENVMLALCYKKISLSKRNKIACAALEAVNMQDRKNHLPSQLSGGQMQRVAIARTIAADSPIILADEPTGSLDSKNGEKIIEILKTQNKKGKTVIYVTHDTALSDIADRKIIISDGRI